MTRLWAWFAAAAVLLVAPPAWADPGPATSPQETPLTRPELAAQRGGIMTPLGIDIGFAASVRTYVDGQLALESKLAWTDQGAVTSQAGDPAAIANAAASGGWSAVLPGTGGETRILQQLSDGRIASVVANTASDRLVNQQTDITLTLPQLGDLQRQVAAGRLAASMEAAVGMELRNGTAR